ncbi:hypothetical protein J3R30DRAFT_1787390 [Lentinula aciculospora]|uniref:REJ domain-containing protein n=1 Tax=Lentinula aciculospora TaxID=153920 RepID=A0A9W9DSH8_9AGAR|nr:hypothetical protein J3R30DRAFT_1787390 [Lentinula aciculospora]
MFIDSVLYGRADTTTISATSSSTSVSFSSSTSASTATSSSPVSGSSSSSTSSASISSSSTSTSSSASSSFTSVSSTQSSSITSSASSTSASATPSQSASDSNSDGKEIGAIVGGVIGGLMILTLLSVIFTVLRRRRRNAKKRPRGSVYLDKMDQSQLDTFFKQKPRSNVDSMHSSSSMPLLSLPQVDTSLTLQPDTTTGYTDLPVPVPVPYSDREPTGAAHENDQNGPGDSESVHSVFLPSPYSQHGHNGNGDDAPLEPPQPRLMNPSSRPESQFYAPIPVQAGDFSMKTLEASASSSRSSTPMSLSMVHGKKEQTAHSPPLNEASASQGSSD